MDALSRFRAGMALMATAIAAVLAAAAPAPAAAAPKADAPTYHWVHFVFDSDTFSATTPRDNCTVTGFGYNSGSCSGDYSAPSAWQATEPFRGRRGHANWVEQDHRVDLAFKAGDDRTLEGWIPSRDSDRFTVTDGHESWPHASAITTGNDPAAGVGEKGGPLRLQVEYHGGYVSHSYQFQVSGWVRYTDPVAPRITCPTLPVAHVGEGASRPYTATCTVTGTPTPTVRVITAGQLPDGLALKGVDDDRLTISGRPTSAGTSDFGIEAVNAAGSSSTLTSIRVEKATTMPSLMVSTTTMPSPMVNATTLPYGAPVTLSAFLGVFDFGLSSPTPTGSVTFSDDAVTLGTVPVKRDGATPARANLDTRLPIGSHNVRFTYPGDGSFTASSSLVTPIQITQASTTTTVTSSANPSAGGDAVRFAARVGVVAPGSGTPTGTVQFSYDGQPLGDPVEIAGGSATSPPVTPLAARRYPVSAVYSGDGSFRGSGDALDGGQLVNGEQTVTTVQSSDPRSSYAQPVTFSASVRAVTTGRPPLGRVQFTIDGDPLGDPVALQDGRAAAAPTTSMPVGRHAIGAVYLPGSVDFGDSRDDLGGAQVVSEVATAATLTSSKATSTVGEPVTFTASVRPTDGGGIARGTVGFTIDDRPVGDRVTLVNGAATLTRSDLALGHHTVEVDYRSSARPGFRDSDGRLTGGQQVDAPRQP